MQEDNDNENNIDRDLGSNSSDDDKKNSKHDEGTDRRLESSIILGEDNIDEDKDLAIFDDEPVEEDDFMKNARLRSHLNLFLRFFYVIVTNWFFNFFITIAIILNTITLAADDFPQSVQKEGFLKICNIVFTWLFFAEMTLKLIGLGP